MGFCYYQSQNYKIWKQFTIGIVIFIIVCFVVINHKTTKFESNSQSVTSNTYEVICCYQSQNYKIWKQFTTVASYVPLDGGLLSITKLQNLKAIHNGEKQQ